MTLARTETHEERFLRMINETIDYGSNVAESERSRLAKSSLRMARDHAKADIDRKVRESHNGGFHKD